MSQPRYVASVGDDDKERLAIQHESFLSGTEQFLTKLNLQDGMNVLVVGCGGGDETAMIAKKIRPTGTVTAIDISLDQINVCREKMNEEKINNVRFKTLAAEGLKELIGMFDVVYCRMLLVHVAKPREVLSLMMKKVKNGGILACEEPDISTCFTAPESPAFKKHIGLLCEFIRKSGCDPDLGSKTYQIFQEIGCSNISIDFFQPAITESRLKKASSLSAISCGPQYILAGLATESEVNNMINEIEIDVVQSNTLLGQCRMTQIFGRK